MLFRQIFDQDTSSYTYVLADRETGDAVIIDPVITQCHQYLRLLGELRLSLRYTLDTHVHADHITAATQLKVATGCQTVLGDSAQVTCMDRKLHDGEALHFGRYALTAIATPGHTAESYCFYMKTKRTGMIFTGDTLLIRGTGRTDFQDGDAATQYHSLTSKVLVLPDDTIVYPGHDYKGWTASTIGEEKAHNPRLQVADVDAYCALMVNLKLPSPKYMKIAVPANLQCGAPAPEV